MNNFSSQKELSPDADQAWGRELRTSTFRKTCAPPSPMVYSKRLSLSLPGTFSVW